jgi:hypothetical protein
MQLDKVKIAASDPSELLKLARSIKASVPTHENNPVATQFFDGEPSNIRQLDTNTLVESLAGQTFNEKVREVEDLVFAQRVREQTGLDGMSMPTATADVSQIGRDVRVGAGRSASKEIAVTSGAKVLDLKMQKAFAALPASARAVLERAAAPSSTDAILTATLKSIVHELLGLNAESFDEDTLKNKIAAAVKLRPDLGKRLTKALGIGSGPDANVSLAELVALGAKVEQQGSRLHISV